MHITISLWVIPLAITIGCFIYWWYVFDDGDSKLLNSTESSRLYMMKLHSFTTRAAEIISELCNIIPLRRRCG